MQVRSGIRILLVLAVLAGCADTDSPVIIDLNPPPGPPAAPADTIAPEAVDTISLTYSALDRQLALEWDAPCDDTPDEAVSQYEIRFASRAPFVWDAAVPVIDPPAPSRPGRPERYLFLSAHNGESLYCAIRSADEAGNVSPVSEIAALGVPGYGFEGRIWDLYSGAPVAGVPVTLVAADTTVLLSGADGTFRGDDLPLGPLRVMIAGTNEHAGYHAIDYTFDLVTHTAESYPMIPVRFTARNPFVSYLALFRAATEPCQGSSPVLLKWRERPVALYIPHWVNANGIDYRILAVDASTRWMVRTGLPLFTIAGEPPENGIIMHFKTREEMGSLIGITRRTYDPEGYPVRDDIEIVNDFADAASLYRIIVHELGHTIRLCHLNFQDYIMYPGQPLPNDISDDEVEVVRMHEALPIGADMSIYVDRSPE